MNDQLLGQDGSLHSAKWHWLRRPRKWQLNKTAADLIVWSLKTKVAESGRWRIYRKGKAAEMSNWLVNLGTNDWRFVVRVDRSIAVAVVPSSLSSSSAALLSISHRFWLCANQVQSPEETCWTQGQTTDDTIDAKQEKGPEKSKRRCTKTKRRRQPRGNNKWKSSNVGSHRLHSEPVGSIRVLWPVHSWPFPRFTTQVAPMNERSATVCLCWFAASRCNCRQWSGDWLPAITANHQTNRNDSTVGRSSAAPAPRALSSFIVHCHNLTFFFLLPIITTVPKMTRRHKYAISGDNLTETF